MPSLGRDVVTTAGDCRRHGHSHRDGTGSRGRAGQGLAVQPAWPDRDSNGLRSSMYEGVLTHRRFGPGPTHSFSYKVAMPLLDLAEVDEVMDLHPAWSARRAAPVRFRRQDFLGDPAVPLDRAVRDLVSERTGRRPGGPVALLANLRTWGWLFNPISLYFCADVRRSSRRTGDRSALSWPRWRTRPGTTATPTWWAPRGGTASPRSSMCHPSSPMGLDYELHYTAPGERLTVGLDVLRGDQRLFTATLFLRRRPLDRAALGRLLWSYPAMTHRVTAGIYAHAARLRLKGAPFFTHPALQPRKEADVAAGGVGPHVTDGTESER